MTIIDIDISKHGIIVELEDGRKINSSYIVDASGFSAILAKKFGLKEQPTRLKTESRTIFTHMVNVKDIDDCLSEDEEKIMPWKAGTVHHVFDGGWMWVIPFNNHDHSSNPVCSVGLNLNLKHFPRSENILPELEFKDFLSKFPTISEQFEHAQAVQPWIATNKTQYSSSKCMGERFYILPHASGFIDPIFSVGLIQSLITISPLAALILQAIKHDSYADEKFVSLEKLQQKIFDYYDGIANCTYISFRDFTLLNSWLRFWLLQHLMSVSKLIWEPLIGLVLEDRKGYVQKEWSRFTEIGYLKAIDPVLDKWGNGYVGKIEMELEKVEKGLISSDEAASRIISLLYSTSWLFRACEAFVDPSKRYGDAFNPPKKTQISFLAYSLGSQVFLKKEVRPFNIKFRNFIDQVRWGVSV